MVRCVVVLSGTLAKNEILHTRLVSSIKCHNLTVIEKDWEGEPHFEDSLRLAGHLETAAPDCIVAIGGGGVLDAAKTARILYEHPDLDAGRLARPFSIPRCRKSRFVAIPTTIGTGTEASSSSVLKDRNGKKKFVVSHELIADYAILDPAFTASLSKFTRITTMADALTHAVESFVSVLRQPQAMDCAAHAVATIARLHAYAFTDEYDADSALDLQFAALYAGYAQNHCLVGASHALAHAAAESGIGHGLANAFYLPATMRTNAENPDTARAYEKLAEKAGLSNGFTDLLKLAETIREATGSVNWPALLSEAQLAEAVNDPGGRGNPTPLSVEYLRKIEGCAR